MAPSPLAKSLAKQWRKIKRTPSSKSIKEIPDLKSVKRRGRPRKQAQENKEEEPPARVTEDENPRLTRQRNRHPSAQEEPVSVPSVNTRPSRQKSHQAEELPLEQAEEARQSDEAEMPRKRGRRRNATREDESQPKEQDPKLDKQDDTLVKTPTPTKSPRQRRPTRDESKEKDDKGKPVESPSRTMRQRHPTKDDDNKASKADDDESDLNFEIPWL